MGTIPARNATRSGMRPRRAGLCIPSAMPTIGSTMKHRTRATGPNSRFTVRSSFRLEQGREPGLARGHHHDADDAREKTERLEEILPTDRAEEHRFPGEIGACRVELFSDQGVVAGRDEERKLRRIGLPRDLDRTHRL